MSISQTAEKPMPFGTGRVVSDSFSLFFRHILKVLLLGMPPALIGLLASGILVSWHHAFGQAETRNVLLMPGFYIDFVLDMGLYGIGVALLVQLTYDVKEGGSRSLIAYYGPALATAFPNLILTMLATLAFALGLIALIVPGLWLSAALSLIAPAVVIERAGFSALSRSFRLTKGYRWPIVAVVTVLGIVGIVLLQVVHFVFDLLGGFGGPDPWRLGISVIVLALLGAITNGLFGVGIALIYARLREIKEGTQVRDLILVFD